MTPLKVIGAGYGRTGTDSLRAALNILGYNTHHMKCIFEDPTQNPDDFYHAYHHRKAADWDKIYANYDAAVDWPTATFYIDLLERYPNAKVILTVRSADSWYTSVKNTIYQFSAQLNVEPGHPMFTFKRMVETCCLDGKICRPEDFEDEQEMKRLYVEHIEDVKHNVPEQQLLVLDLGEGWERLCQFLEKDVPDQPYPNANSTAEFLKYAPAAKEKYMMATGRLSPMIGQ